jgi:signal transduction histidine kinase/CheY-like chemotaxis protein
MAQITQNSLFPALMGLAVLVLIVLALCLVLSLAYRRAQRIRQELAEERDRLENQLVQARRMEAVGILAGSIVHNLNNLLAVILGHSRMAMNEAPARSPLAEDLEKVAKAGQMAGELVQDLSDFYRQADQALKPTDLVPVVTDTLKLLRDILPPTVEIKENLAHRCAPVMASATGVQQVLMNLFSNSINAIHRRQGIIEVSLGEERIDDYRRAVPQDLSPGSYVKLTVTDNGRGMDRETLDHIFNSYFSTSDDGRGMGIGLSTVHRILRDHEGVTIPHSTPGRGTSFDIYFPMIAWKVEKTGARRPWSKPRAKVEVAQSSSAPSPDPAEQPALHLTTVQGQSPVDQAAGQPATGKPEEITVLLVDDQEMVAQVTSRGLQRQGFRVITHTDGRRALDDFVQTPEVFDVVVTDQIMPHISGVRLTRRIRSVRPDIPVILITGFRDSFNEKQAREAGVTDFVLKPTSHRDLAELIRRALLRSMEEKA